MNPFLRDLSVCRSLDATWCEASFRLLSGVVSTVRVDLERDDGHVWADWSINGKLWAHHVGVTERRERVTLEAPELPFSEDEANELCDLFEHLLRSP